MKKYKTWEVIKMLTENPKLKFKTKASNNADKIIEVAYSYFSCRQGENDILTGINDEWTLVQEPVSFMEAVKAYHEGKTIRCEYVEEEFIYEPTEEKEVSEQMGFTIHDRDFSSVCTGEILYGKWYIEEDEE